MSRIITKVRFKNNARIYLILAFFIWKMPIQAQTWDWIQQIGALGSESCDKVTTYEDGSIYISGSYNASFLLDGNQLPWVAERDIYLSKLDEMGTIEWVKTIGSVDTDETTDIITDSEGNIYWTGSYWVSTDIDDIELMATGNSKALFLAKYSKNGEAQWAKSISGSAIKLAGAITTDESNNSYLAGSFEDSLFIDDQVFKTTGEEDLFIAKFDPDGNLIWLSQSGLSGQLRARDMVYKDDHLSLVGIFKGRAAFNTDTIKTNTTDLDVFVAKFDANGTAIWGRKAGGVHEDESKAIALDESGNIYITGHFLGVMKLSDDVEIQTDGFNDNFYLLKYDPDGTPQWARSLGNPDGLEYGETIIANNDSITIAGYFSGNMMIDGISISASDSFDGFISSFSLDGNLRWLQQLAGMGLVLGSDIAQSADGSLLLTANFQENVTLGISELMTAGSFDGFLAKIMELVSSTTNAESQNAFQIFPNPASNYLNISLVNKEQYSFSIYNPIGQLLKSGNLTDQISLNGLANGMYFIQIQNKKATVFNRSFFIQN